MIIQAKSFPRAGLVGNPSDGYFGKTISFAFENFCAEAVLYQTPELEILPNDKDQSCFKSVKHLVDDVRDFGYYGGIRLLKAAIKKFYDYCCHNRIITDDRNFTIRYSSNIPHRVGLAGSSAIITACMKALMSFYQISIPKPELANLILAVEKEELQISAGLQDRVAQVYEGLVYMDFNQEIMEEQGFGIYENLEPSLLPGLYVAYQEAGLEGSEVFHNNISHKFQRGEPKIVEAMKFWAHLTTQVKACLLNGEADKITPLLNSNFDMRKKIYRISDSNLRMVNTARSTGASAKFSGSGGAIVGTCKDQHMYDKLCSAFEPLGIKVLRPIITNPERSPGT
jgi:glucuronokinase